MTPFGHKQYQDRCLDALRGYLREARGMGAKRAFVFCTERPYHEVERLPNLPYVCLKVPTGGGKTVLACRAVAAAAQEYLRQERCVVLWLVPTDTIRAQTLRALHDRDHPYRGVIEEELRGPVAPMDLAEALSIRRDLLDGETVLLVSTLAALRVENTEGRKVYEQNGSLMGHLDGAPEALLAGLEKYEGSDKPIPSLANVLRLRRPVVIMDEAHNARTPLSFETLARFDPSCVVEFTATPAAPSRENPSNVLYQVSAAELKAEEMIKLPVRLEASADWRQTLLSAINRRRELEALADAERAEGLPYLRPIVLVQAQRRDEELTVNAVRAALLELGVPAHHVAVETGDRAELRGVDVMSPACPVRFIITVDKLREGWDCSFAYVLCSVRSLASPTAVEQILGRVLRMPNAARRSRPELNQAYAYVTSPVTAQTAQNAEVIRGALEANGFSRFEAQTEAVQTTIEYGGLFGTTPVHQTPAERREPFDVPQLALFEAGDWEPFGEDQLLAADWNLATCDAVLSEEEFSLAARADAFRIDVTEQGRITNVFEGAVFAEQLQQSLAALSVDDLRSPPALAVWLDSHIPHPDIPQAQAQAFLIRMVHSLLSERGMTIKDLSRSRLRLRDAAAAKIAAHRRAARRGAYERLLFEQPLEELRVTPDCVFSFRPQDYPANALYPHPDEFQRHYYRAVGAMNREEVYCARIIDTLPPVQFWVRNLERREGFSFWLPMPDGRFFPDFIAQLDDGRHLVIEYKGEHLQDTADTEMKRRIGDLWEARSDSRCLFRLVTLADYEPVLRAVS